MLSFCTTTALFLLFSSSLLSSRVAAAVYTEMMMTGSMEMFPRQAGGSGSGGQLLLDNLQPFSEALGGFSAPSISQSKDSKRPFEVGGDTFTDFSSAADRACDNQKNDCADAANSGGKSSAFSVSECDKQNERCKKAATAAKDTNFATFSFSDDENSYFCEE